MALGLLATDSNGCIPLPSKGDADRLYIAVHVLPWEVMHRKVAGLQVSNFLPSPHQLIGSCAMIGNFPPDMNGAMNKTFDPVIGIFYFKLELIAFEI